MKDNFQTVRKWRFLSRVSQFLLAMLFMMQMLWIGSRWPVRYDLTSNKSHSLSAETLAYIQKLPQPLAIYVTLPPHPQEDNGLNTYEAIRSLLKSYEFAAKNNELITLEFIDPNLSKKRLELLSQSLHVPVKEGVYLQFKDKTHALVPTDFYKSTDGSLESFIGEQAITSAIIHLLQDNPPKIYFTVGHGELQLDDVRPLSGLSQLQLFLKTHGVVAEKLNIATQGLPKDAKILIIPGPMTAFLPEELHALTQYLETQQGSIALFLASSSDHNFEALLANWGLMADRAHLIEADSLSQLAAGDILLRRFAPHPITQSMIDYQLPIVIGASCLIRPDPAAAQNLHRFLMPLVITSHQSFAKRDYRSDDFDFDALAGDLPGPLAVGILAEQSLSQNFGVQIHGGRILLMSTADWICNQRFELLGNQMFFWNMCQHFLDEPQIHTLPSRPIGSYRLSISLLELTRVIYILMLPALFLGCIALWSLYRRSHR